MKEIIEALGARIKSPVLGYYSLFFVICNWKPLFYLFFEEESTLTRITYFEDQTNINSIFIFPSIIASLFAIAYPWVNYVFLKICTKPTDLKNILQAQSEHRLLVKKKELEETRSKILQSAERELIDRAKRDEELNEIQDEELRKKLKEEILLLREQRDELKSTNPESSNFKKYKELMEIASDFRQRSNETNNDFDASRLRDKASDIEEKAHKLVMGEYS